MARTEELNLAYYTGVARERWPMATPFRVAVVVAENGADIPCPYQPGSRGERNWSAGLRWGRERRQAALRIQRELEVRQGPIVKPEATEE